MKRTHKCSEVTSELIGEEILRKWLDTQKKRPWWSNIFDLRDEGGLVQVVYNPDSRDTFLLLSLAGMNTSYFPKV